MEILVVTVILGTIIAFAIPKYDKSMQRACERTGADNLNIIRTAMEIYGLQHGGYVNGTLVDLDAINTTLGLAIYSDKMTYICTGDSTEYLCSAQSPYGWQLIIMDTSRGPWTPAHCLTFNCPACKISGYKCPWDQ